MLWKLKTFNLTIFNSHVNVSDLLLPCIAWTALHLSLPVSFGASLLLLLYTLSKCLVINIFCNLFQMLDICEFMHCTTVSAFGMDLFIFYGLLVLSHLHFALFTLLTSLLSFIVSRFAFFAISDFYSLGQT